MKTFGLLFIVTLLAAVCPAEMSVKEQKKSFNKEWKVLTFINKKDNSLALVNIGSEDGVSIGQMLKSYRVAGSDNGFSEVKIETGRLKIVQIGETQSLAKVYSDGSDMSKASFPDFPGIMAHDFLTFPVYDIAKITQVIPEVELSFFDLFKEPKSSPLTFELLDKGMELLRHKVEGFAERKVGFLLVAGHTDHNGSSESNQIESYERALTVKQYLVNVLGFDSERVLALGFGENEPKDKSNVSGYIRKNRRIVIKTVVDSTAY